LGQACEVRGRDESEVYGFLPPHPTNPPTKRPIVSLMKQARAFGVGILVATQNPMDLDYRALSNAGLWCVGRLQTDADRPPTHLERRPARDVGAAMPLNLYADECVDFRIVTGLRRRQISVVTAKDEALLSRTCKTYVLR